MAKKKTKNKTGSKELVKTSKLKKVLESDYYVYDYLYTYRTYLAWGKTYYLDFCILADKTNPHKKTIRFQKRFFGVTKKMRSQGETRSRWVIFNYFNLNPTKDFPSFYKILQKFREGKLDEVAEVIESIDFNSQVKQIAVLSKDLKSFLKKKRKTKKHKTEINLKQEKIDKLSNEIKKVNEENRKLKLQKFKTNIKEYRLVIKEIKTNLDKRSNNEHYFQQIFSNHKWIFGPWFDDVIPKRKADAQNEPDFVLKRYDGFCDVVEIEAPGKKLFTKPDKSKKSQPRAELIQALSQVIDYIDSYNESFMREYYRDAESCVENPLNPYRPRGLLIIGRDNKDERKKLRQLNSFLNHITIMTYDEFLMNARSMLDLLEKKK